MYDAETERYYLQSRYYDPELCRFINADGFVSTGQGLLGNNMFAYCNNSPVNGSDPCGSCFHRWDFWNDCGECGGMTIKAKWDALSLWCADAYNYVTNDDSNTAKGNLRKDGFTFYKGVPTFSADWLNTSGFSFGIIVIGSKNLERSDFDKTLNHEYGHVVQMKEIGMIDYFTMVAIPSLIGAAFAKNNETLNKYYYNLPWERSADYFGDVERNYLPFSGVIAKTFWKSVKTVSYITPY